MAQNSAFSELYLQVQARISQQVPLIRFIDEDKGQIDSYETKPPVSWPCVLIGYENVSGDDMGDNTQMIQGQLSIRLGFPPFSSASSLMPQDVQAKGLRYFDYEWQIYKALHGWKPDGLGYLSFKSARTEQRHDPLRVRDLRYEFNFEEYSAQYDEYQTIPGKPTLDFEG